VIIRGGTLVASRGVVKADLAIRDGLITEIAPSLDDDGETIDATGLHIFPGGIDSHVHFNEPGRTEWEDIAHGTAALLAGGYTAFIDMPLNNLPVTTTVEAFDLKLAAMRRSAKCDFGLWGGLVPGNLDQLAPLVKRGAMGFKAFMCPSGIDEFPASDERTLLEGMARIAELDSILLVHAEDPFLLTEPAGPTAADFIRSRPPEAEVEAIETAIGLAEETGCRLHIVHVSTPEGARMIETASGRGVDVSGETCPHYMLYVDKDLERIGGTAKCAPPFRAEPMPLQWIIVSDHSPSTHDLKQGDDFGNIWGGISGCQSTRQLLLAQDQIELYTITMVTSSNIAMRFRIEGKGQMRTGYDADLWLVDLSHEDVVRREDLLYKNRFSAHEGQKIRGRTVRTLARGADPGSGRLIKPAVN
jgi:allantoinase